MGLCMEYTRFRGKGSRWVWVGNEVGGSEAVGERGAIGEEVEVDIDTRGRTEVYLVGRREELAVTRECPTCHRPTIAIYHIQGVAVATAELSAEEFAVTMCRDETYFIGPLPVNALLPHERCDWPGAYFPLLPDTEESPPTCLPVLDDLAAPPAASIAAVPFSIEAAGAAKDEEDEA